MREEIFDPQRCFAKAKFVRRRIPRASRGGILALVVLSQALLGVDCSGIKQRMYEPADRDRWQQPERVIASLAIEPGQRVADLGAGGGYFTFHLAKAVGLEGRVYAIDVDPDMTALLERSVAEGNHSNVEVLLVDPTEPELPDVGFDLIFTCNTYHHIDERTAYFERVKSTLNRGGRVAIIDHKPEGWFQKIFPHSSQRESIRSEMDAAGYRLDRDYDYLSKQSFLVFSPEPD